ncbi:MAG: hypothetical protein J6J24_02990 [Clostridia bacterium]|nr:hypothetical protein [Clostridia bacterium]
MGKEELVNENGVAQVKALLKGKNIEILSGIRNLDESGLVVMEKLEICMNEMKDDEFAFNNDELYAEDREFVQKFSKEELKKFGGFQDYVRSGFEEEVVRAK